MFVVRQETVERRAIQTGGTDGDRLEVVSGLAARRSRRRLAAAGARPTAFASWSRSSDPWSRSRMCVAGR